MKHTAPVHHTPKESGDGVTCQHRLAPTVCELESRSEKYISQPDNETITIPHISTQVFLKYLVHLTFNYAFDRTLKCIHIYQANPSGQAASVSSFWGDSLRNRLLREIIELAT